MKSFTLLLVPLLFLSSCTIDWNDAKDAKIAELEKQITNNYTEKQISCSERAKEFLKTIDTNNEGRQENHYNRKLDQCFTKISIVRKDFTIIKLIYDVDENRQYARHDSSEHVSQQEFGNLTKKYMEN